MSPSIEIPGSEAFVASNGELAWRREDVERVLTAIAANGRAILGGEVWLITGDHTWTGLIPQQGGGPANERASTQFDRCRLSRTRPKS